MSTELFVDAGAWITLADADDRYHQLAAQAYPQLLHRYRRLVTTNLAIAEAYIVIRRALGHTEAMAFLDGLSASPRIEKVCSDPMLEIEAERILRQYADQDFSYVDAVSFALMHHRGLTDAFTFDQHFATAGFTCVPPAS
jgi:predicted nucleic acid-binding protein